MLLLQQGFFRGRKGKASRRFSPPEGIFAFATTDEEITGMVADDVSVPLRGFLLLLLGRRQHPSHQGHQRVSVPLRGFLLLLLVVTAAIVLLVVGFSPPEGIFAFATEVWVGGMLEHEFVSVPLRGFLLLLPWAGLPRRPLAAKFQSP